MRLSLQNAEGRKGEIMLFRIGFILMMIGTALIDSKSIVIPFAITATGAALIYFSICREDQIDEE